MRNYIKELSTSRPQFQTSEPLRTVTVKNYNGYGTKEATAQQIKNDYEILYRIVQYFKRNLGAGDISPFTLGGFGPKISEWEI
jgi:hypothetical protein